MKPNNRKFTLRLISSALSCLMLISPLAAQAAEPVQALPQGTAQSEEENASGMSLSDSYVTLTISSTVPNPRKQLSVAKTARSYTYLTWDSDDTSVASVDSSGVVTAHKAGWAYITCRTSTGESATCKVTVEEAKPALNVSALTLTMHYDDRNPTKQLTLKEGKGPLHDWRSSAPEIASVSADGLVTALAEGSATISATTYDGQSISCKVTVASDIGKVLLNTSYVMMYSIGDTAGLSAVMDGSAVAVTWTSSNPAVATVDGGGVVTAVGNGDAYITATAANGTSAVCHVYCGRSAHSKKSAEDLGVVIGVGVFAAIVVAALALAGQSA